MIMPSRPAALDSGPAPEAGRSGRRGRWRTRLRQALAGLLGHPMVPRGLAALLISLVLLALFVRPPVGSSQGEQALRCPEGDPDCRPIVSAQVDGVSRALPHVVPVDAGGPADVTYRVRLDLPSAIEGSGRLGVCMPRSPLLSEVSLDGRSVLRDTPDAVAALSFARPLHVLLGGDLAAGPHELLLRVRAPPGLAPGLGAFLLGDSDVMRESCTVMARQAHDRSHSIAWVMATLGVAGLMLWWTLGERAALWLALTALAWVSHLLHISTAWIDMSLDDWSLIFFASRVAFIAPMLLFALCFASFPDGRLRYWIGGLYTGGLLVLCGLPVVHREDWLIAMALVSLPLALMAQAALLHRVWREFSVSRLLMTLSFALMLLAHVLDLGSWWSVSSYGSRAWSYVAVPLLCIAFGMHLIERLVGVARLEARTAVKLQREVDAQRVRIAADYERLQQQREQLVVLEERRRIMRDMHDGLGAHLLSASAMLRTRESLEVAQVAELFDDALKELRSVLDVLSVDPSSDPEDDPISALLGTLRWRMAPALQTRGTALHWHCDALPARFLRQDAERMHLLRLLQEAFSNVLKHAQAGSVRFAAHCRPDGAITIEVHDDGCGFAVVATRGIGLDSMRARAAAIGARLTVRSDAGRGTVVALDWPPA
ncbi:signal transduction histidine kinase [Sphaerotilus hippei]|uniref:histidine kinase n=1 Tax=Sphaerotilus hippei TaxID=744406 RepID=A0A318H279_9BURK|nr:ATP-binding protein [Sphaerotilus hippei]PXW97468.1 signal transduction histidine kinase [Sphaerotilus hippei]